MSMRRRRRACPGVVPGLESELRLWSLRLAAYGVRQAESRHRSAYVGPVAQLLALEEEAVLGMGAPEIECRLAGAIRAEARRKRSRSGRLRANLGQLAMMLGLTAAESAVLIQANEMLHECAQLIGVLSLSSLVDVLHAVLGLERAELAQAVRPRSTLAAAGLIEIERHRHRGDLTDRLDLLAGLAEALITEQQDIARVFERYFEPAQPPRLALSQYPHLARAIDILARYLAKALERRAVGVNVLVYGPSGTGKTELVRALGTALGARLYEVASADEDGDPREGAERLRAYRLCQRTLRAKSGQLVLFDEIEDAFPEHAAPGRYEREAGPRKGWLTRLLETNPVPSLWVSNQVAQIDPALLRRFDLVLKVPVPPAAVKRSILEAELREIPLGEDWLARVSRTESVSPADIARTAKVGALIAGGNAAENEGMLEGIMRASLEVRGETLAEASAAGAGLPYRIDCCETSVPLDVLAAGLARTGHGRVCLYGPPGTGKTAFARHLAERLGRPLIEKRASDLLGMYVGQTEAHIAAMFREAAAERAVLLLDEADSFLRDRQLAQQSWQVSQVNELLTRMESFEGLFLCATNLMESLDAAALRRFDVKVEYRYLSVEQAWALFCEVVGPDADAAPEQQAAWRARLGRITCLAPGDFATVLRRGAILGAACAPQRLLAGLEAECAAKPEGRRRPIGFVA